VDRYAFTLAEALRYQPEIALICGPASTHIDVALTLADAGVHLFVEKPLSHSTSDVTELLAACGRRGLIVMVGYNLRFLSSLAAMREALLAGSIGRLMTVQAQAGQYLPDWRPNIDYRMTASASEALGGGVTLELSHELDYVRWIGGEIADVFARTDRLGDLAVDVEDTAEILLRFESGALGSVHLDMVQRSPVRTCRLTGTEGTLLWDGIADNVHLYGSKRASWQTLEYPRTIDREQTYVAELAEFLDCVRTGTPPRVTALDGLRAVEIVEAVKESARMCRPVTPLGAGLSNR
jgi:predicted dehydrogenase